MNYRIESSGEERQLIIDGEITIEHAADLKKILVSCIEEAPRVLVDLQKVTAMDLSALQLLCSAHRTATDSGKHFALIGGSRELNQVVDEAGYSRRKGCALDRDASCIWCGGAK